MREPSIHTLPDGNSIAYHKFSPSCPEGVPGIIFLGGYASDMTGSKATFLEGYCRNKDLPFVRFDYRGHGESSGKFGEFTIGQWVEDATAVLDHIADKGRRQILIGSSMGGWIMLLVALRRPQRLAGLLGIAAAPDFTEELIWKMLKPEHKRILEAEGMFDMAKDYCADPACEPDPYPVSLRLIEEAREHLIFQKDTLPILCPVRLLHGMADRDVPYMTSVRLAEKIAGTQVAVTLLKDGGHRMSAPTQLLALSQEVERLLAEGSAIK